MALFRENKESVILVSSTNLDSIMKFYHVLPCEMAFVCDAYQAKLMLAAMEDKEKMEEHMADPLVIYSKWTGYLKGKHADPQITEFIGSHRMEILHTSGHAYVETIEKLIHLTNPKTVIPMHTECADGFEKIPEFAPYRDRVKVLQDKEEYSF